MGHGLRLQGVAPASARAAQAHQCAHSALSSECPHHPSAPLQVTTPFPEGKLVYEFCFDKERGKWVPWMDTMQQDSKALDPE